ncbi:PTS glucitol/sorbitol transporter subunit IIA [Clostridium botulinum]|uniref:PTS glucitol/sorbitol transporter subunit IIA n=1 Tax=Clostridium botulinum TaxID=1491 RepID=UPI0005F994BB|nr:PTS glucitol/sorbitol transporter subunit IIA [Clostridium botulinum]AUN19340.1 PTS sorbitol transporter subunit IIA [Clostridium botulinum]KEI84829.1 PTS sorbitol transporter subunit IIA [Clostridium botulinum B2 267]MBN3347163.1 PTS sorbitol transporter subunit IIA [Clostridium botulinum]MBY6801329.1 PTS glucitol/sorbitol transporter subunit IIA [Clostridium botulinum]MCC5423721.1 PTS glucitol/sorbitol transporter subunit IIA [Clostridium botulinum]
MKTIYNTEVNKLGIMVEEFYGEKMIILFKDNAPEELADYCVLHGKNELNDEIQVGDIFKIDGEEYKVTAVGDEVYKNLRDLGHICVRFDGSTNAELPGSLYLEDKKIKEIKEGTVIEVERP